MPFDNYNDLVEACASFLGRDDLHVEIPDFIRLAELRLQRDLKVPPVEKQATGNLVAGQAYIAQPADFLEPKLFSLSLSSGPKTLTPVSADKLNSLRAVDSGEPTGFKVFGTRLELGPIPGDTPAYELWYLSGLTRLSEDAPTSWLLDNGGDALLYGALLAAQAFLGADARALTWKAFFDDALESLGRQAWRARFGGAPLASRPDTVV